MKFVVALDTFKDCASSLEIGAALKEGILDVFPKAIVDVIPIADGGEGTVEALCIGLNGTLHTCKVQGPLGETVSANYGLLSNGTAIIEMAKASGLELVPPALRNPLYTSTYGTGQLIMHALSQGAANFIIGIGGSATNDAGMGMLTALGVQFLDKSGEILKGTGADLIKIHKICTEGLPPSLKNIRFQVACDVNNPLYGENGAAYIYGPQKGASPEVVRELDSGLKKISEKIYQFLGKDISSISGAGAAGGLGGALLAFLDASLSPGIDIVLDCLSIENYIKDADYVFVGEGRLDEQTAMGKAPEGVARRVKNVKNIPVIALGGSIKGDPDVLHKKGITAYFSIVPGPITLEEALNKKNALAFARRQGKEICFLIKSTSPACSDI